MADSPDRNSIFSQRLDRTAFTAYFLGAIVPLLTLVVVVHRYVLPELDEKLGTLGMIALVTSVSVLSLASYLVLRRTTRQSLERMDRDNQRLEALVQTSERLTRSEHASDIAQTAAQCALELSGASAAYLLVRGKEDVPPELFGSAGEQADALFQSGAGSLIELATMVVAEGRPAFKGAGDKRGAVAMMPLHGESSCMGALAVVHRDAEAEFESVQIDAVNTLSGLTAVALRNADLRDAQRNFFSHMTEILVTALDAHLNYHGGHGNRVAQLANQLGRELGLDNDQRQNLHFAALLHDIGMLRFDRNVHRSPGSCEKHTVFGARMLGRIRLWEHVAPIVGSHHEWYDGNGYPEQLAGDAIPLGARVIAVCDAFDAMTSTSSYQVAVPFEAAVEELRDGSGTQFDPKIVQAFLALVERGEISGEAS